MFVGRRLVRELYIQNAVRAEERGRLLDQRAGLGAGA